MRKQPTEEHLEQQADKYVTKIPTNSLTNFLLYVCTCRDHEKCSWVCIIMGTCLIFPEDVFPEEYINRNTAILENCASPDFAIKCILEKIGGNA